jgi:hypothetical protein
MISKEEAYETDLETGEEFELRYAENEYEKQGRMSGKVTRSWVR